MSFVLSDALQSRIEMLAQQNNTTPETLLFELTNSFITAGQKSDNQADGIDIETYPDYSKQYYRGLIESQIDLVCRYTPDTVLTYVNDAYCEYFDRSREELLGMKFINLSPDTQLESIYARIDEVLEDPSPGVRIFSSSGKDERLKYIQWVDYGIVDKTGTVIEIQAIGRDITSLMETKEQLAEREATLSTIFNNIPVLLAQFDETGAFEYVNKYWVDTLGWTIEDMKDHPDILSAYYPDPRDKQEAIDFMLSGERGWKDFKTTAKNGTVFDIAWTNVLLHNGRRIGIGQVITHRIALEEQRLYAHQLEAELEKEYELRVLTNNFTALISHEFRTPLAVINSSASMMLSYFDSFSKDRIQEKLRLILHQVAHMVTLMEDVLQYSKDEAGKTSFTPQKITLRDFCVEIITSLQAIDRGQHKFNIHCDEGDILADPQLLHHILINILSNAIKYSPEGTTIHFFAQQLTDQWIISIEDEGIGIPPDDLDKLFDPFYRAQNVQDYQGTGLGLAIAKSYIEIHNGSLSVESEVGVGTTFTIEI